MNSRCFKRWLLGSCVCATAVLGVLQGLEAQSYSRGQNVSPAFEGWERNADGSFNFLFGYMNRNWEEELDVPIGPDNNITPGTPDQGQPTHFLPRRNRFVFRVRVPADFGEARELVWTLTTHGKTEKAYATLRTDYFIDDVVMASETGALGAGTSSPEVRSNKRPDIRIEGEKTRSVKVGQPLTLTALVSDDGIPKPRDRAASASVAAARAARGAAGGRVPSVTTAEQAAQNERQRSPFTPPSRNTVGKVTGLHMGWFVYRGAGKVTFRDPQVKVWEDTRAGANSPWAPLWQPPPVPEGGRYVTQVTFDRPGTYVLRARADDGALVDDEDLTVTVTN